MSRLPCYARAAWEGACVEDRLRPGEFKHVDRDNMPIVLEGYGVPGPGGWEVDEMGYAVAYMLSGLPAMGDDSLEEVRKNVTWIIPPERDGGRYGF